MTWGRTRESIYICLHLGRFALREVEGRCGARSPRDFNHKSQLGLRAPRHVIDGDSPDRHSLGPVVQPSFLQPRPLFLSMQWNATTLARSILYHDRALIVVNKPHGLVAQATSRAVRSLYLSFCLFTEDSSLDSCAAIESQECRRLR